MNTCTLLLLLIACAAAAPDVQIQNLRLFYDQNEYFIKGMAYSPSPLDKTYDGQNTGPGLCDPKPTYGIGSHTAVQSISGCNTEDYFDGTVYTPGPSDGWWTDVWKRDFPLIQQLGVNTIRIYHASPITQSAITNNPAYTDKTVLGANHLPFMDMAQSYGLKVMFPLFAESAALDTVDSSYIQEYIQNIIDEVGNHPALLMYTFGNELQFSSRDQSYINKINGFIDFARAYQKSKWGRKVPFTVALIDIPSWYTTLVTQLHIDVVTTNAGYRGMDFSDLWSTNLYPLSCQTGIPALIGEMGVHQDTPQFNIPSWFPSMWSDIIRHKTQGAIGGFYFSWVEEHWKGVTQGADWTKYPDVYMGVMSQSAGSGTYPVDIVTPKYGTAYDWSGALSGYAQNPFSQDSAKTLGNAPSNYCDGTFSLAPEPVIVPPVVSQTPNPTTATVMPSPLAHFSFDSLSGGKIKDLTNNNHDAVLYGSPQLTPGVSGSALTLDGTQSAALSDLGGAVYGTFTFATWIYLSAAPAAETKIASSKTNWNDQNGWELTMNPGQKTISVVGGGSSVAQYSVNLATNSWFHVAVVVDGASVNLYFNGAQAAGSLSVTPVTASSTPLYLGSEADAVAFLTAAFDEVLVFSSVVGSDQIKSLADSSALPTFSAGSAGSPSGTSATSITPSASGSAQPTGNNGGSSNSHVSSPQVDTSAGQSKTGQVQVSKDQNSAGHNAAVLLFVGSLVLSLL